MILILTERRRDYLTLRRKKRVQSENDDSSVRREDSRTQMYFLSVSRRFSLAKWAVVVAIPVFLVVMLGMYHNSITYDNLTYLLRDFSSDREDSVLRFSNVNFEEQTNLDVKEFRGEIAVVGSSAVTLYNNTGEKTFDYPAGMENPTAKTSDRYLLAYDLGGTKYSIYTNLTRIMNGESEAAVENASVANNGAYLLVKRARDAKYTVSLYDSSFRNRVNYYKSRFVSDAVITPSGDRIVIASVDNEGAVFTSKVEVYDFAAEEPMKTFTGAGYLPIGLYTFTDGGFVLICDDRLIFFDKDGNECSTYMAAGSYLSCADVNGETICAVYSGRTTGRSSGIFVFDNSGKMLYNIESEQKISNVSHSGDYVFALGTDTVIRYTLSDGISISEECDLGVTGIISSGDYAVISTKKSLRCVFGASEADQTTEGGSK